jgi:hypothetical protein
MKVNKTNEYWGKWLWVCHAKKGRSNSVMAPKMEKENYRVIGNIESSSMQGREEVTLIRAARGASNED